MSPRNKCRARADTGGRGDGGVALNIPPPHTHTYTPDIRRAETLRSINLSYQQKLKLAENVTGRLQTRGDAEAE